MKHFTKLMIATLCLAFLGAGCAWKQHTTKNAQDIQTIDSTQKRIVKMLQDTKKVEQAQLRQLQAAKRQVHMNTMRVIFLFRRLMRNPTLTMRDVKYRKYINAMLSELDTRNRLVGVSIFGDAYDLAVAEHYLTQKNLNYALWYYNRGIKNMRQKIKAGKVQCGLLTGQQGCAKMTKELLANAHYNRACVHSLMGKKAKAKADLEWLDKTGNMKRYAKGPRPFWKNPAFKNLASEAWYKKLVQKYKVQQQPAQPGVKPTP